MLTSLIMHHGLNDSRSELYSAGGKWWVEEEELDVWNNKQHLCYYYCSIHIKSTYLQVANPRGRAAVMFHRLLSHLLESCCYPNLMRGNINGQCKSVVLVYPGTPAEVGSGRSPHLPRKWWGGKVPFWWRGGSALYTTVTCGNWWKLKLILLALHDLA